MLYNYRLLPLLHAVEASTTHAHWMISLLRIPHLLIVLWLVFARAHADPVTEFFGGGGRTVSAHTNNWAVLVCSSRYWFNYRVRGQLV